MEGKFKIFIGKKDLLLYFRGTDVLSMTTFVITKAYYNLIKEQIA